jgi:hypothetical protein
MKFNGELRIQSVSPKYGPYIRELIIRMRNFQSPVKFPSQDFRVDS